MKTLVLVMLCVVLGGCASTPRGTETADGYCAQYDCEKMQRVSKDARRNGHIVLWVTPPLKEKSQRS